jgi:hypothetical protein
MHVFADAQALRQSLRMAELSDYARRIVASAHL